MLVLPEEDKIFFLCWLHHSIFNINVVLQIDQLKKLISEGKKRVRKINYTPGLILCRLKENSSPNIAPGQEILLFINTKWNFTVPQRVWVLEGRLKGRFLISPKHLIVSNRFSGLWLTARAHPGLEWIWRMLTRIIWKWLSLHGHTYKKLPFRTNQVWPYHTERTYSKI